MQETLQEKIKRLKCEAYTGKSIHPQHAERWQREMNEVGIELKVELKIMLIQLAAVALLGAAGYGIYLLIKGL